MDKTSTKATKDLAVKNANLVKAGLAARKSGGDPNYIIAVL